uniref:Uncharacterized protein n=1 Tax=Arundo donax TaxID=35708 RepID=A0A0A9BU11_ARUDO
MAGMQISFPPVSNQDTIDGCVMNGWFHTYICTF